MKITRITTWIPGYVAVLLAVLLLGTAPAIAGDVKEKEASPKAKGKTYEWKTKDGLVYWYRVPKKYDHEAGANLTVVLHGSNLSHGWGFWNHDQKTFRPNDILVSPDGTTPNGRGGFNFMGQRKDAARFHEFLEEMKSIFNVKRVYLYGHSQGSFFGFYYAGEYPADVDGVVGQASGVWTQTQQSRKGHHQAIVLMHGTHDPVVPYGQSVGGYESYVENKYPLVRLHTIEGWNHWPPESNRPTRDTSLELAYCEGMTTDDPERLEACLETLSANKSKPWHDYAALWWVANRVAQLDAAPEALRKKAAKARTAVDALAASHVAALDLPEKAKLDGEAWIGHLALFLRHFRGVPSAEVIREEWAKTLEKHQKDGLKHLRKFWPDMRKGDVADAFDEGLDAIEKGFLYYGTWNYEFLDFMAKWRKAAESHDIGKRKRKKYDALFGDFEKARKDGFKAFEKVNAKAKL